MTDCGSHLWKKANNKHLVPTLPLQIAGNVNSAKTDFVIVLEHGGDGYFDFVWSWSFAFEWNAPRFTESADLLQIHPFALGGIL